MFSLLLGFFVVCTFQSLRSQNSKGAGLDEAASLKTRVAGIYGPDDALINGRVYFAQTGLTDGHPCFEEKSWSQGTVYIKGRAYPGLKLKYNIETEELILKARLGEESFTIISLNKALVDSFNIRDKLFVHARNVFPHDSIDRFFEMVYQGDFTFLRSYRKEFKEEFTNLAPDGKYSKTYIQNLVLIDGEIYRVNTRRRFLKLFPVHKKEIRKFMKTNDIRYSKADTYKLKKLMFYCGKISAS